MTRRGPITGLLGVLGVLAASLVGCTTGAATGTTTGASTGPRAAGDASSSTPSTSAGSTPAGGAAGSTSAGTAAATPAKTPTAAPTAAPTQAHTPAPTARPADYCTAAQLSMRIVPGGATPGYEIAAVTFINNSSTSCSLSGYPAVQLRRSGTVLVTASPNRAQAAKLVHLAPGAQAQAQIRDHVTCQGALSDSVRAVAPAPLASMTVNSQLVQMRGCTVTVDPIALSS